MADHQTSSVTIPHPLADIVGAPRALSPLMRVGVLLKGSLLALAFVVTGLVLFMLGLTIRDTGWRTLPFVSDDVPGVVIHSHHDERGSRRTTSRYWWVVAQARVGDADVDATAFFASDPGVGNAVTVRVPRARPDLAWIVTPLSPSLLFPQVLVVVFITVAVLTLGALLARNARDLRLLRRGRTTVGHLVARHTTETRGDTVWTLTWEYATDRGLRRTAVEVPEHEAGRLVDDHAEPMLYDPLVPERALVLDALPDRIRVVDGRLVTSSPNRVGLRLLPVAVALAGLCLGAVESRLLG
jgi:hypothetical protein